MIIVSGTFSDINLMLSNKIENEGTYSFSIIKEIDDKVVFNDDVYILFNEGRFWTFDLDTENIKEDVQYRYILYNGPDIIDEGILKKKEI